MSLKEELQKEREIKIVEYALDFAENIKAVLIESAQAGFRNCEFLYENEDEEDAHIIESPEFLNNMELLLDGCKVEIKKFEPGSNLLFTKQYKSKLIITWS